MADSPILATAFQLPVADGWLSATLTRPEAAARCAVLLCPPLVEERKAAQRAMVDGARHLAATAQCAVLRIDYRGCGDSSGDFEAHAVDDWLKDIDAASAWLAEQFPQLRQVRLGVRTGALLALQRAASAAACLLWEPVSGADFIKQLLQRRMVNDMIAHGRAQVSRNAVEAALRNGDSVDLDGYAFTGEQYRQLGTCTFPATALLGLAFATGADTRSVEAIRQTTPQIEARTLRLAPFWNSVGHVDTQALAEASAEWIRAVFGPAELIAPVVPAAAVDPVESPLTLDRNGAAIRTILHRPVGAAPRAAFLFLGGWSGDRQGPHRLFLRFARRLARQGNLCLRIDYRGRGESDGRVGEAGIGTMIDDADVAVHWIRSTLPAGTPITLVAICSGCKVAIGTAVRHADIRRLVLWSAEVMGSLRSADTNRLKTLGALRAYGRKLLRRETWRKILTGKVQTKMVGKAIARHETRSTEEARAEDVLLAAFRNYAGAIRFIYGGSDPDAPLAAKAYTGFCTRHRIPMELTVIPHAGHSYYGAGWRDALLAGTETWLASTSDSAAPVQRKSN